MWAIEILPQAGLVVASGRGSKWKVGIRPSWLHRPEGKVGVLVLSLKKASVAAIRWNPRKAHRMKTFLQAEGGRYHSAKRFAAAKSNHDGTKATATVPFEIGCAPHLRIPGLLSLAWDACFPSRPWTALRGGKRFHR